MALRVLLDHGVKQEHIVYLAFLVARGGGIRVIRRAFPDVRIVCGALDDGLGEGWVSSKTGERRRTWPIEPGMGNIGTLRISIALPALSPM